MPHDRYCLGLNHPVEQIICVAAIKILDVPTMDAHVVYLKSALQPEPRPAEFSDLTTLTERRILLLEFPDDYDWDSRNCHGVFSKASICCLVKNWELIATFKRQPPSNVKSAVEVSSALPPSDNMCCRQRKILRWHWQNICWPLSKSFFAGKKNVALTSAKHLLTIVKIFLCRKERFCVDIGKIFVDHCQNLSLPAKKDFALSLAKHLLTIVKIFLCWQKKILRWHRQNICWPSPQMIIFI